MTPANPPIPTPAQEADMTTVDSTSDQRTVNNVWLLRIREVSFEVGLCGRLPPPCTG